MATEPQPSETMSGAASSSEPADAGADAALIVAALGRIETALRGERATLDRLRVALRQMAQAIAQAKTVADSETAAAMLDEFEHRVDAMIEMAGGIAAAEALATPITPILGPAAEGLSEAPAESDQVPTVSGVVLRLGPGDAPPEPAIADPAPAADAGSQSPTVAMLTAMVEALNASVQTPPPEAEAAAPKAEPASLPGEAADHETALLASLEQMGVRPIPPPDEGTAVIFSPKPATELQPEPSPPNDDPAEPAATPEPEQAGPEHRPAATQIADEPATQAGAAPAEPDSDPTDFLFGPEPEPDPAAFLLDPAPPRIQKPVVLPQPEFVPAPAEPPPASAPQPKAPQAAPAGAPQPDPEPEPHDPLHALKAMSENERLAIFS